jgi:2-polyprenyl-3-methyl-5-hydroxy-6-metoxy-1,4-benzoquinol methylase
LNLSLTGVDISEEALGFARARAAAAGVEADWVKRDVLADGLPGRYDVVISSLFLHHLTEHDAISLLSLMAQGASQAVFVQDLIRSRAGLALASVVPRIISRSYVVHTDAILSARAAFSMQEVCAMAEASGMPSAKIRRVWPERFLLDWRASARA